jgi:hypothetical protein
MQRRKERGNDGQEVTKEKRRGTSPDEITRGRGELPGNEKEMQEETDPNEVRSDFKNDRRQRRRDRHE